jgi:hypothetical protein
LLIARFRQKKYDQGLSEAMTVIPNTLAGGDGAEKRPEPGPGTTKDLPMPPEQLQAGPSEARRTIFLLEFCQTSSSPPRGLFRCGNCCEI